MLDYNWNEYGGENFEEVKSRVIKILKEINKENDNEEVLIVAHGGIVRLLHFLETGETLNEIENASLRSFDLDKILN